MNPGDVLENALWIDGRESPEQRARFEKQCNDALQERAAAAGVMVSPIRFVEKHPMDDRVPEVPKHISGPRVRLLVGTAVVLGRLPDLTPRQFVADLDHADLMRLRELTRRAHQKRNRDAAPLTDEQCDAIIEQIGPESAARAAKAAVDSGMVH